MLPFLTRYGKVTTYKLHRNSDFCPVFPFKVHTVQFLRCNTSSRNPPTPPNLLRYPCITAACRTAHHWSMSLYTWIRYASSYSVSLREIKVVPPHTMKAYGATEVQLHSSTSKLDYDAGLASRPNAICPRPTCNPNTVCSSHVYLRAHYLITFKDVDYDWKCTNKWMWKKSTAG